MANVFNRSRPIVIVGGSLAGLTCSLAFAARGLRSHVFERSASFGLTGGALGVDRRLLAEITGIDPTSDSAMPALAVIKSSREATSWQLLYQWLRGQALAHPLISLTEGADVSEVRIAPEVSVELADGSSVAGTAILGADGYRSIVRRFVDPDLPLAAYSGYMLWRGLVSERTMPASTAWPDNDGFGTISAQGHRLIAYPVPGVDGSTSPGERQISFAWYDIGRDELLREQNCLSQEGTVLSTLPFHRIPDGVLASLVNLLPRVWPQPWRVAVELAIANQTLFATPISEYLPRRLTMGPVAILGDAAHAASPMTGRGYAMGAVDAGELARYLSQARGSVLNALSRYEMKRLPEVRKFVEASQALSKRYVRSAMPR